MSSSRGFVTDQTAEQLIVTHFQSSNSVVTTVMKSTGIASTLWTSTNPGALKTFLSLGGNTVTYYSGNDSGLVDLRRIDLDGMNDALVASQVGYAGVVSSATSRFDFDRDQSVGTFYCVPLPGNSDCRGAPVKQLDATTFATIDMGSFENSAATNWRASGVAPDNGIGNYFVVTGTSVVNGVSVPRRDLYTVKAGVAGSIKRVTDWIP